MSMDEAKTRPPCQTRGSAVLGERGRPPSPVHRQDPSIHPTGKQSHEEFILTGAKWTIVVITPDDEVNTGRSRRLEDASAIAYRRDHARPGSPRSARERRSDQGEADRGLQQMTPHVEIQRAPHGRGAIEVYVEGKRVSVGKPLILEVARASAAELARSFGSHVIDHTR
jgi:hypothetical protein